jgi:hypothetical protein
VATEVADGEPEVEDVVCRLPRLLKSTMIYTRVRRTRFQGEWY